MQQQTESADERSHFTLFDTGPDSTSLVRNLAAMRVAVDRIERVVLSHWHSDHSGGLLSFLKLRSVSKATGPCVVDVHPDRPSARGIAPGPTYETVICALPSDPTFELIRASGGIVEANDATRGHTVAGDTVWVSGEIPRVTPYEDGIPGGMRWVADASGKGQWTPEQVSLTSVCRHNC